MKRIITLPAVFLLLFVTGCASTKLESNIAPGEDLSLIKTIYVEKFPNDERGIEELLASRLNEMGFSATSGTEGQAPRDIDAILAYQDKWMWDLTMYMLELRVQVEDPETEFVKGSAFSYRTSLVRRSPKEMVAEVLNKLFGEKEL